MFDDSSSCREKKERKKKVFPNRSGRVLMRFHVIYLTEKVCQDLFGQGGRHRAQLHGGQAESDGRWGGGGERSKCWTRTNAPSEQPSLSTLGPGCRC